MTSTDHSERQPRWLALEEFLVDVFTDNGGEFTSQDVAEAQDIDPVEASQRIQSYLDAQISKNAHTLYVLHRIDGTRTAAARWTAGAKARDIRAISKGLYLDIERRIQRAYDPTLNRIAKENPRAARAARDQIEMIGHALRILELAVNGQLPEDP